jgi:glycosyltransferase involved in cell wall biosynthesis
MDRPPVVLVVPAYNEAASIADVLARCLRTGFPVVVVDDGSTDGTADIVGRLPVDLVRQPRNRGKGAALLDGIRHALRRHADDGGAARVVTLDGDGQHRPEDVARLIAAADHAPDAIIIGSRRADRAKAPPARYAANRIADFWISWAAGQPIDDTQSGFRLYPPAVLAALRESAGKTGPRRTGFAFESELLIDAARRGTPIGAVAIPALYGFHGQRASHFRPVRDIAKIVLMVAGKLLAWGMHPLGLLRVLRARNPAAVAPTTVFRDDAR